MKSKFLVNISIPLHLFFQNFVQHLAKHANTIFLETGVKLGKIRCIKPSFTPLNVIALSLD